MIGIQQPIALVRTYEDISMACRLKLRNQTTAHQTGATNQQEAHGDGVKDR